MSIITQDRLRELYLEDLRLPDVHHGRTTPKVKNIHGWRKLKTVLRSGDKPRVIDPHGVTDIWLWSDIHFGHGNIIKYSNRPYPNRQLMDQCLIGNYLNVVKPQDICIFGGDIGFMKPHDINHILKQLPGYKIQIIGNHDLERDGTQYDLAFDETHLCMVIDVPNPDFDVQLLLTHYPMDNVPDGCYSVHGHIHTNIVPGDKHMNMCVEHTNYQPKHLKHFIERARRAESYRVGIPVI